MIFKLLILSLLTFTTLRAELLWENVFQKYKAGINEAKVDFVYKFKNIGKTSITITKVQPSCDCTFAKIPKTTYKPNESGEISVSFDMSTRTGLQKKEILVESTDSKTPVITLAFEVDIPQPFKISPRLVFWTLGEKISSKKSVITIDKSYDVKLELQEASFHHFFIKMNEIKKDEIYELEVKATDTSHADSISVEIPILIDDKPSKPATIYIEIKDPKQSSSSP